MDDLSRLQLSRFLGREPDQNDQTKGAAYAALNPVKKRGDSPWKKNGRGPGNEEDDGAPNILTGSVITSCFIQTSALPSRVEMAGNDITFFDDTYMENGEVIGDTSRLIFTHGSGKSGDQITQGFIMEKRASIHSTYDNVLSWYATPAKEGSINWLFIGRDGRGDNIEFDTKNISYIEIISNVISSRGARPSLDDPITNGIILHKISVDQITKSGEIAMTWAGSAIDGKTGVIANLFGSGDQSSDDIGYGAIGYLDNDTGTILSSFEANKYGFQVTGLPTSSAGLPSGCLWNDAGTLKIIP